MKKYLTNLICSKQNGINNFQKNLLTKLVIENALPNVSSNFNLVLIMEFKKAIIFFLCKTSNEELQINENNRVEIIKKQKIGRDGNNITTCELIVVAARDDFLASRTKDKSVLKLSRVTALDVN